MKKQKENKPVGKFWVDKINYNKRNYQYSVCLPKKKLKSVPTKVQISYW